MASCSVEKATRKALTDAGVVDSPLGQSALALAEMLDDSDTASTARVAAAKELRATLGEATAGRSAVKDPVDELRERRERRLAGAG